MKKTNIQKNAFPVILRDIKHIISKARYNSFNAVNAEMLKAYYAIGRKIIEEEQKGEKRAEYGEKLIESLSAGLIKEFGKGFSITALKNMRIFYTIYKDKIGQSLTDEFFRLSWTHYCELIKTAKFKHEDVGQTNFYLNYVKKELNKKGDNDPIGIILCTEKDNVRAKYAITGMLNKLFVSKYKLYLPSKEELEAEIERLL